MSINVLTDYFLPVYLLLVKGGVERLLLQCWQSWGKK